MSPVMIQVQIFDDDDDDDNDDDNGDYATAMKHFATTST